MSKENLDSVGRRLFLARQQAGLNQYELRDLLRQQGHHIGQGTISNIENGRVKPRKETIRLLALALELDPDYLDGETENLRIEPTEYERIASYTLLLERVSNDLRNILAKAQVKELA